jgi:hypothetical protein
MKDPQNRNIRLSERVQPALFLLFAFLLPTQTGQAFFFSRFPMSRASGSITSPQPFYLTDILALVIIILNIKPVLAFFRNKKTALFLIILAATGFFSQVAPLFLYRFLKVTEVLALFSIFRHRFPQYRKQIILGFAGGAVLEAGLGLAQLLTQRSLQGVFYYLGERYMTLSTPGIAKASLAGTELLRPYGTFFPTRTHLPGFSSWSIFSFLTGAFITNRFLKYSVIFMASMLVFFSFPRTLFSHTFSSPSSLAVREKTGCRICTLARTLSPSFWREYSFLRKPIRQALKNGRRS